MTIDEWRSTSIDGVLQRNVAAIQDERGSFSELWRASITNRLAERMVQANLSRSRRGVLRGMHFHLHQVDLWTLLEGRVAAATTDLRGVFAGGAPSARSQVIEMAAGDSLYIPRRVAHGFWALEDSALLYLVSNEYEGTDEHGFAWDDPAAAISWPGKDPVLSNRDRLNPSLTEAVANLGQQMSPK
ncbi:MAG: dTDP-4-dehydrorhamnose 3,5-epimerase [Candidatus Limnocylindrales bacterium]